MILLSFTPIWSGGWGGGGVFKGIIEYKGGEMKWQKEREPEDTTMRTQKESG